MKHILILISSVFLFVACAPKKQIVIQTTPTVKKEINVVEEQISLEDFAEIVTSDSDFKLAIVFPSKIVGKYANSVVNTSLSYLLYKNEKFEMQTFDSLDQSSESIQEVFSQLIEEGYKNVIALYTKDALEEIYAIRDIHKINVYFPIIAKESFLYKGDNFNFGAISYDKQLEQLLSLSNNSDSNFNEQSSIGNRLKEKYDQLIEFPKVQKELKRSNVNYRSLVDDKELNDTTLMLNTPIVKTSIILSQLRANDIKPSLILSTQINYNPILVSLTQVEDRVNFIVASSIEDTNDELEEVLSLVGSDIKYNWVNYSALVGLNYMFNQNEDQLIKNEIINNQVEYKVNLYNSTAYGFLKMSSN